jgi:hypothetical protein
MVPGEHGVVCNAHKNCKKSTQQLFPVVRMSKAGAFYAPRSLPPRNPLVILALINKRHPHLPDASRTEALWVVGTYSESNYLSIDDQLSMVLYRKLLTSATPPLFTLDTGPLKDTDAADEEGTKSLNQRLRYPQNLVDETELSDALKVQVYCMQ